VVAATSEEGRVVTNGMSQYSRAEFNANSGLVVDITPERDFPGGPLAGIEFQRRLGKPGLHVAGGSDYRRRGRRWAICSPGGHRRNWAWLRPATSRG
jgi:uncharacterized FAD-dependent dehydrogenase